MPEHARAEQGFTHRNSEHASTAKQERSVGAWPRRSKSPDQKTNPPGRTILKPAFITLCPQTGQSRQQWSEAVVSGQWSVKIRPASMLQVFTNHRPLTTNHCSRQLNIPTLWKKTDCVERAPRPLPLTLLLPLPLTLILTVGTRRFVVRVCLQAYRQARTTAEERLGAASGPKTGTKRLKDRGRKKREHNRSHPQV
jgi:hypothetical protein